MNNFARTAVAWAIVLLLATQVAGELIPTPSFSDHTVPTTQVPSTDSSLWQWADVALLGVALILSTYFALVSRSRRSMLALTVACLIWFGFVRQGCICAIGSTQNVSLALGDASYLIPLGVAAFFLLPLLFTIFFGRTFCASVCPLGAAQELLAVRTLRVPRWLDQALSLIPFLYLGAAVIFAATGTAFIICRYDPFVAFFRLGGNANMLLFGGCMLVVSVFIGRPYCRYLCPYGALLGLTSRASKWHLRIVPGECIECRLCEEACPYGAIHPPTTAQSPEQRLLGKRQLLWILAATPLIIGLLAWIGTYWAVPLSRFHPTVRLAEQVRLEELGLAEDTTDASDAFRNTGQPLSQLFDEAQDWQERFVWIGGWLGAWAGLVLSIKLVFLSVRRRRTTYHPQQSGCVSCGRCFKSCPVELVRLGLIEDVSERVEEASA
ncbi:MAG: 4Fe-4S binding protein [Pirellulaceae bacterium]